MSTAKSTLNPAQFVGPAAQAFESALKAGLRIQEEAAKRFTDMINEFQKPQDWQKKGQDFIAQWVETVQTSMDESIRVMNQNAKASMEVLQKAYDAVPPADADEAQRRYQELAEVSLTAIRANTQAAVQANGRIVDAWGQFAKQFGMNSD
jgi:hypothetical protein